MKSIQIAAAAVLIFLVAAPAGAITVFQTDDFQDSTTQGWMADGLNPNPPLNVTDAGPLGLGDHALQVTAHGMGGPGTELDAFNTTQWSGDYISAGVTAIRFDANNVGLNPVSLGFQFNESNVLTLDTGSISPGSGWNTYVIPLSPLVIGSPTNLSNVTNLRLRFMQGGAFFGGEEVDVLDDNIHALPEPGALTLVSCFLALVAFRRPRWERR